MAKKKIVQRIIILLLSVVLIFFLAVVWQRHFGAMEGAEIQEVVTAYYTAVGNQDETLAKQYLIISENGPLGSFGEGKMERILWEASLAPEGSYPPAPAQLKGVGIKLKDYGRAYVFGWVLYRSGYIEQIDVWLRFQDGHWKIYRLYEYGWRKIEDN
jgi:hypothetical protein